MRKLSEIGTRTGQRHCSTFSPAIKVCRGLGVQVSARVVVQPVDAEGRPARKTACGHSRQHATCLVRGDSVQSTGGPRLKGSPGEEADRTASWKTAAMVAAAGRSSSACCSGGRHRPCTPQRSQWPEASEASPVSEPISTVEPALEMEDATLHRPPSLPVRISSVSLVTGDSKAEKTARNPSHVARRAHSGRMKGKDEATGTGRL